MKASFIIPLYNCLPLTQAMLASLQATLPAGLAYEIIFVDDGSTDGSRAWIQSLPAPSRAVLNEKNLGFAATCNRGAAAASGEFLFFLNNDLVLLPGWFEPMLAALTHNPRVGLVGNVQLNHATGAVDHTGIIFNAKGKPEHDVSRGSGLVACRPVIALTGACFGIRREVWQRLNGFDEAYVNGCEDVDLGLRAREAGFANFVALHSVVRHHISASMGRKLRDEQNTARLLRRWQHVIVPRIVRTGCREWVAAAWDDPRNYPDPALARDAFLHLCRIWPATVSLQMAAVSLIEVELARWAHLLHGVPARPPEQIAWQLYPTRLTYPPVL